MWSGTKQAESLSHELPSSRGSDILLWLLRQRLRLRVVGFSMMPTLYPGEEVLVNCKIYRRTSPQPGDIVVAVHPNQPGLVVIKRVGHVYENGYCVLLGDNPMESTDSRKWGAIAPNHIVGKVVCRFS
jgi:nickel-type superoxide dismutase maturation protease